MAGLDAGWYDGCDFGPQPGGYESRTGDIRKQTPEDLAGFDAVVNLAAISNDPVGHLNPEATFSVNAHGAAHPGPSSEKPASSAMSSPPPAACTAQPVTVPSLRTASSTR
ncbi:hypothetical protein [Nocardioides sp. B-3]|uniref:hypothetical protein n=1 Tax=Nocardioides sp. B-3 TaxID=2895565 RepID=UPI0021526480|nr:hypothetical protein [Nocardioides sp. B-3]UUZ60422.1 hypothetical protein LP418_05865 [Nocardioides sp. B-3]